MIKIKILSILFVLLCFQVIQALSVLALPRTNDLVQRSAFETLYPDTKEELNVEIISPPYTLTKVNNNYDISVYKSNKNGHRFIIFLKQLSQKTYKFLEKMDFPESNLHGEYTFCRYKNRWDSEIYALFEENQLNELMIHSPKYAIRANRATERLELIDRKCLKLITCVNHSED